MNRNDSLIWSLGRIDNDTSDNLDLTRILESQAVHKEQTSLTIHTQLYVLSVLSYPSIWISCYHPWSIRINNHDLSHLHIQSILIANSVLLEICIENISIKDYGRAQGSCTNRYRYFSGSAPITYVTSCVCTKYKVLWSGTVQYCTIKCKMYICKYTWGYIVMSQHMGNF